MLACAVSRTLPRSRSAIICSGAQKEYKLSRLMPGYCDCALISFQSDSLISEQTFKSLGMSDSTGTTKFGKENHDLAPYKNMRTEINIGLRSAFL